MSHRIHVVGEMGERANKHYIQAMKDILDLERQFINFLDLKVDEVRRVDGESVAQVVVQQVLGSHVSSLVLTLTDRNALHMMAEITHATHLALMMREEEQGDNQ